MPVLLVVLLAVVAFCAPMLVVVLSRGSTRPLPRRAPLSTPARPPLDVRGELAGTVLHAVHPAQDPDRVVAALTRAGFATVVDPDDASLLLVESPADAEQHELVRSILTRRVA